MILHDALMGLCSAACRPGACANGSIWVGQDVAAGRAGRAHASAHQAGGPGVLHIHTRSHTHTITHACARTHTYTHIHTHIRTRTHTHKHTHTHTHTQSHTHAHTYAHKHVDVPLCLWMRVLEHSH